MTNATTVQAPKIDRPKLHLWRETEDPDAPEYVGVLTITNADQLLAETQARGLGITLGKGSGFHLTALWAWAAAVRTGVTSDKFKPFTQAYAWEGVKDSGDEPEEDPDEDPTVGAEGPSIGSD